MPFLQISSSITLGLKPARFTNPFPEVSLFPQTAFTDYYPDRFF